MYYLNILNQIDFLIILCFSLLIAVFTLLISRDDSSTRILGTVFFIPFFLCIASFLSSGNTLEKQLMIISEIALLFALSLLVFYKSAKKHFPVIFLMILLFPVTLLILVNFNMLPKFIFSLNGSTVLLILPSLACLFLLRKAKGKKSMLFWAVLLLLAAGIIRTFNQVVLLSYVSLTIKFVSYLLFFIFFYRGTYGRIINKVEEAEKHMSEFNRSLDMEIKKRTFHIELSNQKLLNLSKTDSLTKAFNKAAILDIIDSLVNSKSTHEFSVLMFDIDHFKGINDTYGHVTGDKCLKKLALIAKACIREFDSFGRYGGDEFIIVLPNTAVIQARQIAERFRKKVEETESPHFTISIGIATYPNDASTVKEMIGAADEGLYRSKEKGRNAVSHKNMF